jgi:ferredoxin
LNSLERYGIVVPAVCRAGACSACRTRLLAGRVFQPADTGLRESDREHGYIHACVSYPLENLRIRV